MSDVTGDEVLFRELLATLDGWYVNRASRYTEDRAKEVLRRIEQVLDPLDATTRNYFSTQFGYAGSQERAKTYYSQSVGMMTDVAIIMDSEQAEEAFGPQTYEVSIVPYVESFVPMSVFISTCHLISRERPLDHRTIDYAFTGSFGGLEGFIEYDKRMQSATTELFRVTSGKSAEADIMRRHFAAIRDARETYHRAVFDELPTLRI